MDKTISFMEDDEIYAELESLARRRGTTVSAVVREAIRMFLQKQKEAT